MGIRQARRSAGIRAIVLCIGMASTAAFASPGCGAVNNGGFGGTAGRIVKTVSGFAAGDVIHIRWHCEPSLCGPDAAPDVTLRAKDGSQVLRAAVRHGEVNYTVTGANDSTLSLIMTSASKTKDVSMQALCTPAQP